MASEDPFHRAPSATDGEEVGLADRLERIGRHIGAALVIGAGFIALAIYARPGPPRYQAFATPAGVVQLDTRSGAMISCTGPGACVDLRRVGHHIRLSTDSPAPARLAPAPPSAPAPAAAPAPPAPSSVPAGR